jgi:hypothetical protein
MDSAFRQAIADGYLLDEPGIVIGSAMHGQSILRGVFDTILRGGRRS